jgi:hypothetical protein
MPNLHIVDDKSEEPDLSADIRKRIEAIRSRSGGDDNFCEYWNLLLCQADRAFLLKCVDNLLSTHFNSPRAKE